MLIQIRNQIILMEKYYNYRQLLQWVPGAQMFSGDKDGNVGTGEPVLADGAELTYAADASYCLMNDIPIDMESLGTSRLILQAALLHRLSARTIRYMIQKLIPFMCITATSWH